MSKVCSFFGHRDVYTEADSLIEANVRKLIDQGTQSFWCGGYGKFDASCAKVVHALKKDYPKIELLYIMPYLNGHTIINPEIYDGTLYPEGLECVPKRFAITRRNQWMVKNSDVVIAWVDHTWGGAYTACRSAVRLGKEIINLTGIIID